MNWWKFEENNEKGELAENCLKKGGWPGVLCIAGTAGPASSLTGLKYTMVRLKKQWKS